MLWLFLFTVVVVAILLDSTRLYFYSVLAIALRACPRIVLPYFAALFWWALTHKLRR